MVITIIQMAGVGNVDQEKRDTETYLVFLCWLQIDHLLNPFWHHRDSFCSNFFVIAHIHVMVQPQNHAVTSWPGIQQIPAFLEFSNVVANGFATIVATYPIPISMCKMT